MSAMVLAELVPEKLGGLPAHPLLVHVPVVLIPLAAVGALLALVVPGWRHWMAPLVGVLTLVSLVGVQLAMESGESLEAAGEKGPLVEAHSQLAEQTRPMVFLFCLFAVAAGVIVYLLGRAQRQGGEEAIATGGLATARKAMVPLLALSLVFGAVSTVWVVRTGHAGAKSVWSEGDEKKSGDEGGERGEVRTTGGSDEQQQSTDGDTDGD